MASDCLIGIDVGTSSLKLSIYDLGGKLLGSASEGYPILHPQPSWAEHDPEAWLSALKNALSPAMRKAHVTERDPVGIGVDCFSSSLVPVDKHGNALRNAFTPLDVRSVADVKEIEKEVGSKTIFDITGNRIATGTSSLPQIMWIRKNARSVFDDTYKFVHANSYLSFQLTGTCKMDWSNAALSLLFDPIKKAWSQEVAETFRIPLDKLPETCSPTSLVGETSTALCNRLGLKSGIPVAAGSIDTNCAALGAGVVKEGQAIDSGGAASCLGVVTDQPHFDNRFLNRCHAVPYRWITVSQGPHSGIALEWFRDEFCQPEVAEAIRTRTDPFLLMDQKAEYAEPGSRGLIFLPYFMGECSPIWDPYATSVFFGITPNHSRGEMIRSILEGTAYNIRHNLEVLESIGIHVNEIRAVGGQSKSDLWLKIRAEITGKRMVTVIAKDSTPLGSAILGGVAAGVYSDPSEAASEICEIDRVVEPEPEKLKTYGDLFEVYLEAYEGLKKASRMRASVLS